MQSPHMKTSAAVEPDIPVFSGERHFQSDCQLASCVGELSRVMETDPHYLSHLSCGNGERVPWLTVIASVKADSPIFRFPELRACSVTSRLFIQA